MVLVVGESRAPREDPGRANSDELTKNQPAWMRWTALQASPLGSARTLVDVQQFAYKGHVTGHNHFTSTADRRQHPHNSGLRVCTIALRGVVIVLVTNVFQSMWQTGSLLSTASPHFLAQWD